MRRLLITSAAAASLLLGAGVAAADPGSRRLDGHAAALLHAGQRVCVLFDAQLGQPYEAPLSTSNEDGGTFTVTGTALADVDAQSWAAAHVC